MRIAEVPISEPEGHPEGEVTNSSANRRSKGGRRGLVSHSGAYLLSELADRTGLTEALSKVMAPIRERHSAHDPGVVLRDLVDLSTWPEGTRLIVRRERPHPGAQFVGLRHRRLPPHRL